MTNVLSLTLNDQACSKQRSDKAPSPTLLFRLRLHSLMSHPRRAEVQAQGEGEIKARGHTEIKFAERVNGDKGDELEDKANDSKREER
jgi:hypothetical protein